MLRHFRDPNVGNPSNPGGPTLLSSMVSASVTSSFGCVRGVIAMLTPTVRVLELRLRLNVYAALGDRRNRQLGAGTSCRNVRPPARHRVRAGAGWRACGFGRRS